MNSLSVEDAPADMESGNERSGGTISPSVQRSFRSVHRFWYWAVVPALAIAAYVTVVRIGFMDDDYVLLYLAHRPGVDWRALLPGSSWFFYRPVGVFVTWELGWELWGLNPLPYHVIGLLLHAATALVLGLWMADLTGRRSFGWLAGVLFGVFPLHLEAVGWVATQWDLWATLFGLLSAWCFTLWWRGGWQNRLLYFASVLFYGLAIWSKESLLTFLPVLGLSVWLVAPPGDGRAWRKLAYALAPFGALVGFNAILRLVMLGDLGNYRPIRSDYDQFFWDNFTAYLRPLLAPINSLVLGGVTAQVVGVLSSIALLLGLIWYGSKQRKLLMLAGAWIALSILPVLSIPGVRSSDLLQNRYLYVTAAGYCVGVAALLHPAILDARRWRPAALSLVMLLVLSSVAVCWVQLRPWHTATVMVNDVVDGLLRLIPPQRRYAPRPDGLAWYVENMPEEYKGSYMLRRGLGLSRLLLTGGNEYPNVERVQDATKANLTKDQRDAFAIRFRFDDRLTRYVVDYASGITGGTEPPSGSEAAEGLRVWDFRKCAPDDLGRWQVSGARSSCKPGEGLSLQPGGNDPQVIGQGIEVRPGARAQAGGGARFLRLRASARYTPEGTPEPYVSEWYWEQAGNSFSAERSRSVVIKQDGKSHVYWTLIPAADAGEVVTRLRFDPINGAISSTVEWIAIDLVK